MRSQTKALDSLMEPYDFPIKLLEGASAAFLGAFFAFLFVRLGEALTKIYERQVKNLNCLVKLEFVGNRYLNMISENIFEIDKTIEVVQNARNQSPAIIPLNRTKTIPIEEDLIFGLLNVDYINELFGYQELLRKLNSSVETVNRQFDLIVNAITSKIIGRDSYFLNLDSYLRKLAELRLFLSDLEMQTKRLIAISRILTVESRPLFTRLITPLFQRHYRRGFTGKVETELMKLEKEIQTIAIKDQERIRNILKGMGASS